MLWMSRVVDSFEVFRIARHAANIFWRAAADGIEQEREAIHRRVVEPLFQLDDVVPAVSEVIEIMDRLGAGIADDIAEPRLAGIDGLRTKVIIEIGKPPMPVARGELEQVAIRPVKRSLKRQMRVSVIAGQ